jgi:hypothetical protein
VDEAGIDEAGLEGKEVGLADGGENVGGDADQQDGGGGGGGDNESAESGEDQIDGEAA